MIAVDMGIPLPATMPNGCNRVRMAAIASERLQSEPRGPHFSSLKCKNQHLHDAEFLHTQRQSTCHGSALSPVGITGKGFHPVLVVLIVYSKVNVLRR